MNRELILPLAQRILEIWRNASFGKRITFLLILLPVAIVLLWLLDLVAWLVGLSVARSTAEQYALYIAQFVPLNEQLLSALTSLFFAGAVFLVPFFLSFRKEKFKTGIVMVAIFSVLYYGGIGLIQRGNLVSPISEKPTKCVVRVDGKNIFYEIVPGRRMVDPITAKPCIPVTDDLAGKLSRTPAKEIEASRTLDFFDRTDGSVRVWYSRARDGSIKLFDNEGVDPVTRKDLLPVTPEVVDEILKKIELDVVREAEDRRQAQLEEERIRQDEVNRRLEETERGIREKEQERQRLAEAEAQQLDENRRKQEFLGLCDMAAGNKYDPNRNIDHDPVSFGTLVANAERAVLWCRNALQVAPNSLRHKYQLARALHAKRSSEAATIFRQLTKEQYPAAFDNLGSILLKSGQNRAALQTLERGANLGSSEAMFNLALLLVDGKVVKRNLRDAKSLLKQASDNGHEEANDVLKEIRQKEVAGEIVGVVAVEFLKRLLKD